MASKPDLTEFFRLSRPKKKPCHVAHARGLLSAAEREQLEAACSTDNGVITTSAIQQWLAARSHDVSIPAITSHRRGTCTCHEPA